MIEEAEKADANDLDLLGTRCKTMEEVIKTLEGANSSEARSILHDPFREDALASMRRHIVFFREGIECVPNWSSMAHETLGTDHYRELLIGYVALGDIRGISSFKRALDQVTEGLEADLLERNMIDLIQKLKAISLNS